MTPPADDPREALERARQIRDELFAAANQLRQMETQAGMGGSDLSVRVKDPDWLIGLLIQAASALDVRARDDAEARVAALTDRVGVLTAALELFAEAAKTNDRDTLARLRPDTHEVWIASGTWGHWTIISLGHLRAARAALHQEASDVGP